MIRKNRVFLDMDGVIADFDGHFNNSNFSSKKEAALTPGFYRSLPVLGDCHEYVELLYNRYDLYIATAPKWLNHDCYKEKIEWVKEHFPYLYDEKRILIVPNKGLLSGFAIIDDHPEWNNCEDFDGEVIKFEGNWDDVFHHLITSPSKSSQLFHSG